MTSITPVIRRMTFEEAYQLGLYSRGLKLEYQGSDYNLNAGLSDKVYIFSKSIGIYVLTINRSLSYIGFDVYMPKEQDPINTVFIHSEDLIIDCLGRNWNRLSPSMIAERLVDYLI